MEGVINKNSRLEGNRVINENFRLESNEHEL